MYTIIHCLLQLPKYSKSVNILLESVPVPVPRPLLTCPIVSCPQAHIIAATHCCLLSSRCTLCTAKASVVKGDKIYVVIEQFPKCQIFPVFHYSGPRCPFNSCSWKTSPEVLGFYSGIGHSTWWHIE